MRLFDRLAVKIGHAAYRVFHPLVAAAALVLQPLLAAIASAAERVLEPRISWGDPTRMEGRVVSYKKMANFSSLTALALGVALTAGLAAVATLVGIAVAWTTWVLIGTFLVLGLQRALGERMFADLTQRIYATPLAEQ